MLWSEIQIQTKNKFKAMLEVALVYLPGDRMVLLMKKPELEIFASHSPFKTVHLQFNAIKVMIFAC